MNLPIFSPGRFVKSVSLAIVFALSPLTAVAEGLLLVTGPDEGAPPIVGLVYEDPNRGTNISGILAYPNGFRGGVRVAVGDVNGDSIPDLIAAPGPGMPGHVRVFDGRTESHLRGHVGNLMAFPGFQGGVFVAAGDIDGDGRDEVIVAPDAGAPPIVKVFDGKNGKLMHSFLAYSPMFLGGVRVATGDVNGDGRDDIITGAGPGGGPHVKVFNGKSLELHLSFFAYATGFLGGVYVAAGDVNNDGAADIVTGAGPGGGPHVKVFDGPTLWLTHNFSAYDTNFNGGVRVAAGDVNGDGFADIITGAGPGGGPHVKAFDSQNQDLLHNFFAYDPTFKGGVFVGSHGSPARIPRGE